ncbi:MAG: cation:proton antiporter [Bryobacterales bacterium]
MNELASLGLILLLALLAGHLVQFLRIPEVTGYILAGIMLGPSVLGWVSARNLAALEVLSEVALGLILFSIGSVFEIERFRQVGRPILVLTAAESLLAGTLVFSGMLMLGQPWPVAALLGAIAIATAPASTLMVIRECNSKGPLTSSLLGIIAVNNIFCLVTFSIVAASIELASGPGGASFWSTLYGSVHSLLWTLLGSVALGFLVGLMLVGWATKISDTGEMVMLLAGSILFCVGVARVLDLSQLIASLAVGATMVNLSRRSKRLFATLGETDPPFYAIFFVIAGADMDVELVWHMGALGIVYVLGRTSGKALGAWWGARRLAMPESVRRNLGFALFAQADLAIGLTLVINRSFAEFAPAVGVAVLAAVVVFEMLGPIGVRYSLMRSGEGKAQKSEAQSIWA